MWKNNNIYVTCPQKYSPHPRSRRHARIHHAPPQIQQQNPAVSAPFVPETGLENMPRASETLNAAQMPPISAITALSQTGTERSRPGDIAKFYIAPNKNYTGKSYDH